MYRPIILLLFCVCGRIRQMLWTHVFAWFLAALNAAEMFALTANDISACFRHYHVIFQESILIHQQMKARGMLRIFRLNMCCIFLGFPETLTRNQWCTTFPIWERHIDPNLSRVGCFSFCLAHVLKDVYSTKSRVLRQIVQINRPSPSFVAWHSDDQKSLKSIEVNSEMIQVLSLPFPRAANLVTKGIARNVTSGNVMHFTVPGNVECRIIFFKTSLFMAYFFKCTLKHDQTFAVPNQGMTEVYVHKIRALEEELSLARLRHHFQRQKI